MVSLNGSLFLKIYGSSILWEPLYFGLTRNFGNINYSLKLPAEKVGILSLSLFLNSKTSFHIKRT